MGLRGGEESIVIPTVGHGSTRIAVENAMVTPAPNSVVLVCAVIALAASPTRAEPAEKVR